jgi:pimeloyl-ACP methyl ester carboxylesterase
VPHIRRAAIFACLLACPLVIAIARAARSQASSAAANQAARAQSCASLAKFQAPGYALTIAKAEAVPAAAPGTVRPSPFAGPVTVAIPQYCRVDGSIDPHTGADGKSYAIGFAIALPDQWNGRFLFQGGGGLDGAVNMPLGWQAAGDTPALARGFAVVSTDSGHKGAVFDAAFLKDQQSALDFALFAFGKVTQVAKQIIAQYYGQPAKHSYFVGCSMGGREAMTVSQRYPHEFDGVVSGDPAMRTGYSNAGDRWAAVAFNQIAPKDASGKPMTAKVFSPGDRKLLVDSILAKCDAKDGLQDGMIFNTMGCHFDPRSLTCKGEKTDSCLTSPQTAAIAKAFAGPRNSLGVQIYPAFPYDTGITAPGPIPGLIPSAVPASPFGPDLDTQFEADKVSIDLASDGTQQSIDTYSWTNFSTFSGRGGKLLFFHGTSDPWFSPLDTLGYYRKVAADNGGLDQVRNWSRLYFVPGMGHCAGGPATLDNFDMLSAVVDWVEKGVAPDSVIATGKDFPGRSRPLCAYPKHAQYKGRGDPQDAANFACVD